MRRNVTETTELQQEWVRTLNTSQRLLEGCNLQSSAAPSLSATPSEANGNSQHVELNEENKRRVEVSIAHERTKTDTLIAKTDSGLG